MIYNVPDEVKTRVNTQDNIVLVMHSLFAQNILLCLPSNMDFDTEKHVKLEIVFHSNQRLLQLFHSELLLSLYL